MSSLKSILSKVSGTPNTSPIPLADLLIAVSGGQDYRISIVFSDISYCEKLSTILAEPESVLAHLVRDTCFGNSNSMFDETPLCLEVKISGREGKLFQFILNYLRQGQRALLPGQHEELVCLLEEAQFFQIFGLSSIVWCLVEGIKLQVYQEFDLESEVVWNPGAIPIFWQSVTVMSRCYHTHRENYLVCGYIRAKTQFVGSAQWWCYDVVCPCCQHYEFSLINEADSDISKFESCFKKKMEESRGRILRVLDGGSCALVEWPDFGWKFHVPLRALLPANYSSFRSQSR